MKEKKGEGGLEKRKKEGKGMNEAAAYRGRKGNEKIERGRKWKEEERLGV